MTPLKKVQSVICAVLISSVLWTSTAIANQTPEPNGFATLSEAVLQANPEELLELLDSPIASAELPKGFLSAETVQEDEVTLNNGYLGNAELEGTLGTVAYRVTPDEDVFDGETLATIQYLLFEPNFASEDVAEQFLEGVEQGLDDPALQTVELVEVGGAQSVLISFDGEEPATTAFVRVLVVPVGNLLVFAYVATQSDDLDGDDVYDYTEELTLASITYLGTVLEDL